MQRISTDQVGERSGEFATVVSKSEEMNKAIGTALIDMTAGLTNNMRQNLQIKTNKMCDDMLVLLSSLRRGKDLLDKVVIAYETADANLKKEVEDWVGDTEVYVTFERKVEILKTVEGFREGDVNYQNYMDWVYYYKGQYIDGGECYAMAHMMQVEIYGSSGNPIYNPSFEEIQVGDALNYKNSNVHSTWGHWVFVTEVRENGIVVAEGNLESWGLVQYGREIPRSELGNIVRIDRV